MSRLLAIAIAFVAIIATTTILPTEDCQIAFAGLVTVTVFGFVAVMAIFAGGHIRITLTSKVATIGGMVVAIVSVFAWWNNHCQILW